MYQNILTFLNEHNKCKENDSIPWLIKLTLHQLKLSINSSETYFGYKKYERQVVVFLLCLKNNAADFVLHNISG